MNGTSFHLLAKAIHKALAVFALIVFSTVASKAHAGKPNVLLIMVDDLKPAFGAYGFDEVHSPNLDRLAAMGMRFDRAYCNQAVCAPSRINLLTSMRSTTSGIYSLSTRLRQVHPDVVTLPQLFKDNGYAAQGIGKVFHIGHGNVDDVESWSVPFHPEKVIDYVLPESTGGELTREEAYFSNAGVPVGGLPRGAAWECSDVDDTAYADGRIALEAINRLRRFAETKEPFFLALGFTKPHLPFCAPRQYWELYERNQFSLTERREPPDGSPFVASKDPRGEIGNYFPWPEDGLNVQEHMERELIHGYFASLSYMDAQLGCVLDELERLELHRNTTVVLWGDHGWHFGDHGSWTKHTNYEQDNHIPLIIYAPEVTRPGTSSDTFVESVDIYPTLSELAGLDPSLVTQAIDGESLVPVLLDPAHQVRDHAYHAYPRRGQLGQAIRTHRYRMVKWKPFGAAEEEAVYELYDYQEALLERQNIAETRPDVLEEIKAILGRHPEPAHPAGN